MQCTTCQDTCSFATGRHYACMRYPAWDDATAYKTWKWDRSGGSYVSQSCPDSCYFNLATCDCAFKPWREDNSTDVPCDAKIDIDFFTGGSNIYSLNNVISQVNGNALFASDDSSITVATDQSFEAYSGPAVIQLQYSESSEITSRHALISSRPCTKGGYLLMTVDRESILLEVSTDSHTLTSLSVPTAGFKPGEFKTVRVVDNNDHITLTVSNGKDAYVARARAPTNPYLHCGLVLGSADFVDSFAGVVNSFSLYQCIPDGWAA